MRLIPDDSNVDEEEEEEDEEGDEERGVVLKRRSDLPVPDSSPVHLQTASKGTGKAEYKNFLKTKAGYVTISF